MITEVNLNYFVHYMLNYALDEEIYIESSGLVYPNFTVHNKLLIAIRYHSFFFFFFLVARFVKIDVQHVIIMIKDSWSTMKLKFK